MRRSLVVVVVLAGLVMISLAFTRLDPIYKNLKVLPKNITAAQMDSVMHHYSVSLNVGCDFCHAENRAKNDLDFASDSNKHKLIARDMMIMTDSINDRYFNYTGIKRDLNSRLLVTCYTCHHGKTNPAVKPQEFLGPLLNPPVSDTSKRK